MGATSWIGGGTHWSLLLVDRTDRHIWQSYHYDSMSYDNPISEQDTVAGQLLSRIELGSFLSNAPIAPQENGCDCGIAVLAATRELVDRLRGGQNLELDLSRLDIDRGAVRDRQRALLDGDGGQPGGSVEDGAMDTFDESLFGTPGDENEETGRDVSPPNLGDTVQEMRSLGAGPTATTPDADSDEGETRPFLALTAEQSSFLNGLIEEGLSAVELHTIAYQARLDAETVVCTLLPNSMYAIERLLAQREQGGEKDGKELFRTLTVTQQKTLFEAVAQSRSDRALKSSQETADDLNIPRQVISFLVKYGKRRWVALDDTPDQDANRHQSVLSSYTKKFKKKIATEYLSSGKSTRVIGDMNGIDQSLVSKWATAFKKEHPYWRRTLGLPPDAKDPQEGTWAQGGDRGGQKPALSLEMREEVAGRYLSGHGSAMEIGHDYSISDQTVLRYVNAYKNEHPDWRAALGLPPDAPDPQDGTRSQGGRTRGRRRK
jgi:hypothetical protein